LSVWGPDTTGEGFHCYAFFDSFPDEPEKFAQAMVNEEDSLVIEEKIDEIIDKYTIDEGATLKLLTGNVPGVCGPGLTVFVTEENFDGDLGGLSGADDKCQEAADAAGLVGIFQAWLSDSFETPASRWIHLATTPYVMLNGEVVATSFADLTDGTINNAIEITEKGDPKVIVLNAPNAWTGTLEDGSQSFFNCSDWSTNQRFGPGGIERRGGGGRWTASDASWTEGGGKTCNSDFLALYCFQQRE